jgi:hypothetical protein
MEWTVVVLIAMSSISPTSTRTLTDRALARSVDALAPLAILVRVYGDDAVRSEAMTRARSRAETIFAAARIGVMWRICAESRRDADCGAPPAADEVIVRLLHGVSSISVDACGVALVPTSEIGHFASVFVDCLRSASDRFGIDSAVLLGCVLAHEIGHVLLGDRRHRSTGIMQAQPRPIDWQRAAHDALRFTSEDAIRLRASLMRRTATKAAHDARPHR